MLHARPAPVSCPAGKHSSGVLPLFGLFRFAEFGRFHNTCTGLIAAALGPAGNQQVQCRDYQQDRYSQNDEVHRESDRMVPIEIQDGQEPEDEKQADRHYHPKVNLGGAATGIEFRHPIAFLVYGHIPIDHPGVPGFLPQIEGLSCSGRRRLVPGRPSKIDPAEGLRGGWPITIDARRKGTKDGGVLPGGCRVYRIHGEQRANRPRSPEQPRTIATPTLSSRPFRIPQRMQRLARMAHGFESSSAHNICTATRTGVGYEHLGLAWHLHRGGRGRRKCRSQWLLRRLLHDEIRTGGPR